MVRADWLRTINALTRKWLQQSAGGCMAGMQVAGWPWHERPTRMRALPA